MRNVYILAELHNFGNWLCEVLSCKIKLKNGIRKISEPFRQRIYRSIDFSGNMGGLSSSTIGIGRWLTSNTKCCAPDYPVPRYIIRINWGRIKLLTWRMCNSTDNYRSIIRSISCEILQEHRPPFIAHDYPVPMYIIRIKWGYLHPWNLLR